MKNISLESEVKATLEAEVEKHFTFKYIIVQVLFFYQN